MAYFDSSKNRVLREIKLQGLRKARVDRLADKTFGEVAQEIPKVMIGFEPVKMTYAELLMEEAASIKKAPRREQSLMRMEKQAEKSMEKGRSL